MGTSRGSGKVTQVEKRCSTDMLALLADRRHIGVWPKEHHRVSGHHDRAGAHPGGRRRAVECRPQERTIQSPKRSGHPIDALRPQRRRRANDPGSDK
jgi:hypothetical protein